MDNYQKGLGVFEQAQEPVRAGAALPQVLIAGEVDKIMAQLKGRQKRILPNAAFGKSRKQPRHPGVITGCAFVFMRHFGRRRSGF